MMDEKGCDCKVCLANDCSIYNSGNHKRNSKNIQIGASRLNSLRPTQIHSAILTSDEGLSRYSRMIIQSRAISKFSPLF